MRLSNLAYYTSQGKIGQVPEPKSLGPKSGVEGLAVSVLLLESHQTTPGDLLILLRRSLRENVTTKWLCLDLHHILMEAQESDTHWMIFLSRQADSSAPEAPLSMEF